MKHFAFIPKFRDQFYIHSRLDGNLYVSANKRSIDKRVPDKVKEAIKLCNNPYEFPPLREFGCYQSKIHAESDKFAKRLIDLCKFNFWVATQYATLKGAIHTDSCEAVATFRNVVSDQKSLCLPRALYAAKTSKHFSESGVIMIGAALPSRSMHAWVIEKGELADNQDREWLHHLPVAALY
jgi:hypothetical protein